MTAINVVTQPRARAAFIISDTAVTAPGGELQRLAGKVIYGTKGFPWAMGVTGNVAPELVLRAIGEANPLTLKQMVKRLPGAMQRAVAETCEAQRIGATDILCQVRGAYWDFARKRPIAFFMQASDGEMLQEDGIAQIDAFTWYDLPWMMGSHETPADLLGRPVDLTDPADFDPERDGLALIAAQRRRGQIDITPGMEPGHCRIGGEVHLTEVRKNGVQVFAIGNFADPVGQRIDGSKAICLAD